MPVAALSSSINATAEKPDKSDAIKLSAASKLKSKPSSGPSPSRSVAFAPGPATPEPPQVASAHPEATSSSTVAATSSGLQVLSHSFPIKDFALKLTLICQHYRLLSLSKLMHCQKKVHLTESSSLLQIMRKTAMKATSTTDLRASGITVI